MSPVLLFEGDERPVSSRASIIERMPVLISSQTANANTPDQHQHQEEEQQENSSADRQPVPEVTTDCIRQQRSRILLLRSTCWAFSMNPFSAMEQMAMSSNWSTNDRLHLPIHWTSSCSATALTRVPLAMVTSSSRFLRIRMCDLLRFSHSSDDGVGQEWVKDSLHVRTTRCHSDHSTGSNQFDTVDDQ